ncbi:SurA N-terminal domain-containing protein [Sphingomonas sp. MG17]|uniref:peptidylprolyl isomerase n=1 Tax=Sphingomonas tagetis TaxID=2949092 RepID=A0A9X2HNX7_9SPHN|nr:SurA N-terminal domain-containing protein [Sphingomonas tagetis]
MKISAPVFSLAILLALGGCDRKATGQVVAVVNGEELTLSDLNTEIKAAGPAASGGAPETVREAALQRLIDRKILVQEAKKRGIEKQPDFLQAERRGREDVLINMLAEQVTRNIPVPTPKDADAHIAAHPEQFAQRVKYNVDQIQFPTPTDRSRLKALEAAHDMAAVETTLAKMNIKFTRQAAAMDSLTTPPELIKRVLTLPPGEPFVIAGGPTIYVSVLTGKVPAPLVGDEARAVAAEILRRKAIGSAAQTQVKQARTAAKIDYQPGFAPKAAPKK